jgi:DNA polymerase-3 subunit gamma/tau
VQQLVAAEAITALVRELALQSQLVGRDTGHWLLRVERESLNQPPAARSSRPRWPASATRSSWPVESAAWSTARRAAMPKQASEERQQVAEEIILNDPFVQQMMRDFDARIVPGSIKPV